MPAAESLGDPGDLAVSDFGQVGVGQRIEAHGLVEEVGELADRAAGIEGCGAARGTEAKPPPLGRGHGQDHRRLAERGDPTLRVGEAPRAEQLGDHAANSGVGGISVAEEEHRARRMAERLDEPGWFVVADVARWAPDKPRDRVRLRVAREIDRHE